MIYTFHRAGGFYPLDLADDDQARANALANPGTLKVVNESNGKTVFPIIARYPGVPEPAARLLSIVEAALIELDRAEAGAVASMDAEGAKEIRETCAEGVASFLNASAGITPLQRLIVGVKYTLVALADWRAKGPLSQ